MVGIPVRSADAADLEAVLRLYGQLSPHRPLAGGAQAQEIWHDLLARPGVTVFVADHDGRPAATCTLVVVPNLTQGGRPYGLVENVVTGGDLRRRGYGRAVLEAALAAAWAAGCYKAMLLSGRKDETGVPAFYESVGFRRGIKAGYEARPAPAG